MVSNSQWEYCISLDFSYRGLSESYNFIYLLETSNWIEAIQKQTKKQTNKNKAKTNQEKPRKHTNKNKTKNQKTKKKKKFFFLSSVLMNLERKKPLF